MAAAGVAYGSHPRYRPYPQCQETSVEQLACIPAHWRAERLGRIGTFSKGYGGNKGDEVPEGIPCVRYGDLYTTHRYFITSTRRCISPEQASAYASVRYGEVLFAASGETFEEIGKSAVCLIRPDVRCGGDTIIFRPKVEFLARFLGYATDSHSAAAQKAAMGTGTTIKHIAADRLKSLVIAVAPVQEQGAIASFLDRETAKIDALVAKKERLIELLLEKRTALIARAVTEGLDPQVPMKDSGVEWLGKIPAHWTTRRLRSTVLARQNGVWGEEPDGVDDLPCIRAADFDRLMFRATLAGAPLRSIKQRDAETRGLRAGDLLIEGSGGGEEQPVGMVVLYDDKTSAVCSNFVGRITVAPGFSPRYLTYLHAALYAIRLTTRSIKQTTGLQNLDSESYLNEVVALAPEPEQIAIAAHLDRETSRIDALVGKVRDAIAQLRELRSATVSAAVTGKIDVRREAAT